MLVFVVGCGEQEKEKPKPVPPSPRIVVTRIEGTDNNDRLVIDFVSNNRQNFSRDTLHISNLEELLQYKEEVEFLMSELKNVEAKMQLKEQIKSEASVSREVPPQ